MTEKAKVLLVDDDPGFLQAMSLFLEDAGYEVLTAVDGPSGLASAREHRPDVVVIDVIMRTPDEGFALARALRAEPELADTGLLVVTAAAQRFQMTFEPDEQWLPVDKVLEKPTAPNELADEIAALLVSRERSEDPS